MWEDLVVLKSSSSRESEKTDRRKKDILNYYSQSRLDTDEYPESSLDGGALFSPTYRHRAIAKPDAEANAVTICKMTSFIRKVPASLENEGSGFPFIPNVSRNVFLPIWTDHSEMFNQSF